jgi:hypothetical protein
MGSTKLYVGNLSYDTSEASLRTAFEAHGEVTSVNLIMDRDSGRPKGFGFVEMGSASMALRWTDARSRSTKPSRRSRGLRVQVVAATVVAATVVAASAGRSRRHATA